MKKNLLVTLFSTLIVGLSFAQLPFSEGFDTGIPATWQNIDNGSGGLWEWVNDSGEQFVVFDSDGFGNDNVPEDADLITPAIDCSGETFVALSFFTSFTQFNASVGTASVSNDGGSTWTSVYTVNATGTDVFLQDISALAAGQSDVRIKFNYVGDYDYFWVIDDVQLYTPAAKDMAALNITNSPYNDIADAPFTITGNLVNLGSETITSYDLNYEIDGGAAVTETITGVSIGFGDQVSFSHGSGFTPAAVGNYEITAYASNLNGGADENTANDEASAMVLVYDVAVPRVPLFEVFTGSTCPPCQPGNVNFHNIVNPKPAHDYVSIKFQQDFPGTGDPYATDESVARRNFYSVNSIPRMEIDGGWDGNANSFTEALYTDAKAKPSFISLVATYEVDVATQTVSVDVTGLPIEDFSSSNTYKLHIAVIENLTTMNVKTNGETEFEQVTKKMLPDNNGTAITGLTALTPFTVSETFAFQGSYRLSANGQAANRIDHAIEHSVEEFSDLRVVVWIEDETNRDVLQAFNAVNPLDSDNDGVPDEVEAYLGTSSTDAASFADADGDGSSDWTETANGTNPFVSNTVGIDDLELGDDFTISPVPANSRLDVAFTLNSTEEVELSIVALDGKVINSMILNDETSVQTSFDVSGMSNGVYFMTISTESGTTSKKFVVRH